MNPAGSGAGNNSTGYQQQEAPEGYEIFQNLTPEQMQLFQSLIPLLQEGGFLQRLISGDESAFADMEAPLMKKFGEMQGQIGNRFSGMGMGAQKGSGFNLAQNQGLQDFGEMLASKRYDISKQAMSDLMNFSNQLLNTQPNSLHQKPRSFWEELALASAGGLSEGAGQAGGSAAMAAMV